MICCTCSIEIPEKWTAAITSNKCPSCNGPIMDDKAKQLMEELTIALIEAPNNPAGLASWLLSKYHIEKITDEPPDLPEFHEPKKRGSKKQGKVGNDFMKRADVNLDPERVKKIMSYINDSQDVQDIMYGPDEEISEEETESSEEDFELAQAMMGKKKKRPRREVPEYIGAPLAEGEDEAIQNMLGESEANLERLEKLAEQERRLAAKNGNAKPISLAAPAFKRAE